MTCCELSIDDGFYFLVYQVRACLTLVVSMARLQAGDRRRLLSISIMTTVCGLRELSGHISKDCLGSFQAIKTHSEVPEALSCSLSSIYISSSAAKRNETSTVACREKCVYRIDVPRERNAQAFAGGERHAEKLQGRRFRHLFDSRTVQPGTDSGKSVGKRAKDRAQEVAWWKPR